LTKKWIPFLLLIVMAIAIIVIKQCKGTDSTTPKTKTVTTKDPVGNVDRNRGFDRRVSYLEYSKHAKCRMECRHITQAEVADIMKEGEINYKKSDLQNARCPRYAVEGETADHQRVRIVFAQCNESTAVVTVIDLDTEWSCDCPGDDGKYENGKR
jgi:hypothetical protein